MHSFEAERTAPVTRTYFINRFAAVFSAQELSHDDAPTARSMPARGNAPGTCPSPCSALAGRTDRFRNPGRCPISANLRIAFVPFFPYPSGYGKCRSGELADAAVFVSAAVARARWRERRRGTPARVFFGGGVVANAVVAYRQWLFVAGNRRTSQVSATGEGLRCGPAQAAAQQRRMVATVMCGPAAGKRDGAGRPY